MTAPLNRPLKPRVTPVGRGRPAPRIDATGAALAVGLVSPSIPNLLPNQFGHEQQALGIPTSKPLGLGQQAPDPFHSYSREEFRASPLNPSKVIDTRADAERNAKIKFLAMPRDPQLLLWRA